MTTKPEAALELHHDGEVTYRLSRARWETTLATWCSTTRAAIVQGDDVVQHVVNVALERLDAIAAEHLAYPLTPIELSMTEEHAGYLTRPRDLVVILLEYRALLLKHPNPFPELVLFPRLEKLTRRLRR